LGLQGLLVAEGRVEEALDLIHGAVGNVSSQAMLIPVIDVVADPAFETEATANAAEFRSRFGENYERAGTRLRWLMGAWHARRQNFERVAAIAEAVRIRADSTGHRWDKLRAEALEGHLALARGDTTAAIELMSRLKPTAPRDSLMWQLSEPLALEKLVLARLLLARREYQRAHDVAAYFDHQQPVMYLPYLAASLFVRLRAAEALEERYLAERYRARLRALGRTDLAEPLRGVRDSS
jgi:hypothetical protein